MSAPLVEPGRPVTWEQYLALPEDARVEYVDGRLLVSPSPTRLHQVVCHRLVVLLAAALPAGCAVTPAWAWKAGPDEFIPDVLVHPVTEEQTRFTGTPLLCVEVLSTNRGDDLVLKPMRYARAGLPRYWVVDPRDAELTAYELDEQRLFRRTARLQVEEAPRGRLPVGPVEVEVDLRELLES